ncbi:MAG TPA: 30S ribosomal protein S16 [bacterium]|nr:30S ribosomal protein S16 [bacterium]
MVKIRLMRMGGKHRPLYRLVVADSRSPRSGRYIEIIGHYNPTTDPSTIKIDEAKALSWLRKGARPSDAARVLLDRSGVLAKATTAEQPAAKA